MPDEARWRRHQDAWRDPAQVLSHWADASAIESGLARRANARSLVGRARRGGPDPARHTRVRAPRARACGPGGRPRTSYLPLPHPSGLAVDRRGVRARRQHAQPEPVCPPAAGARARAAADAPRAARRAPARPRRGRVSIPAASTSTTWRSSAARCTATPSARTRSSGSKVGGRRTRSGGRARSTARAGPTSRATTCSSTRSPPARTSRTRSSRPRPTRIGTRRPGQPHFPVDGRGVIFSGATREPVARGLTRPHSARLSGAAAVGRQQRLRRARDGRRTARFDARGAAARLDARALASRVTSPSSAPRASSRASASTRPASTSTTASAASTPSTPAPAGCSAACVWPAGNQIFAVEAVPARLHTRASVRRGRRRARAR